MRRTTTAVGTLFAVALLLGVTGAAQAEEYNCTDFQYQEDAQAVYDQDTSDPNGLDGPIGEAFTGEQGIACEDLPSREDSAPVEETPTDETPAETPADETPVEETPAEEAPAEETPAEEAPAETPADLPSVNADADNVIPDTSAGVDTGGW